MKRFARIFALAGTLSLLASGIAVAQDSGGMQMGAPDEMKAITGLAGDWNVEFKFRMDPSAEFETSAGKATFTNMVDNCTQAMTFEATMMGMPFKGYGLTSYNRDSKQWESVWVDNMAAHLSLTYGTMTDGKLVMTGKDSMGGMSFHVRQTTYNITADKFEWSMEYSMDGTEWMHTAQAVYTRAK